MFEMKTKYFILASTGTGGERLLWKMKVVTDRSHGGLAAVEFHRQIDELDITKLNCERLHRYAKVKEITRGEFQNMNVVSITVKR